MSVAAITDVSATYHVASRNRVTYHRIEYLTLQRFSESVTDLRRHLASEDLLDDNWKRVMARLVGLRTSLTIAPYDEAGMRARVNRTIEWLSEHLGSYRHVYPSARRYLAQVSANLAALPGDGCDSLLHAMAATAADRAAGVVLVLRASDISWTQSLVDKLSKNDGFRVINPTALRSDICYPNLLLVGPPRWFPPFVFSAPRSENTDVFNYAWIDNSWPDDVEFAAPVANSHYVKAFRDHGHDGLGSDITMPEVDFTEIVRWVRASQDDASGEEMEDARIYVLDGGWVTLLESDPDSRVTVIDLDENEEYRFRQAKIRYLEPGMFVLLRTEGGGDYIVPVADRVMGDYASYARSLQKRWKTRLAGHVSKVGWERAVAELEECGAQRAEVHNLARWLSMRSIKTRDQRDFRAILEVVGLGGEFEEYWTVMSKIVEAHRKAGHYIRQLLLKQVMDSDLSVLLTNGVMSFELDDSEAGSLTAFRIVSISDSTLSVSPWRIGQAVRMDEGIWL